MWRRGIFPSEGSGGGSGEGQGSGESTPASTGTPSAATQNTGTSQGTGTTNGETTIPKARFDEVNTELKKLRKQIEDADRERQQRETDAAKEQGRWKDLAEQHEAKVKELEPAVAKADRYEAALKAHLETQRKDLPAHITALLDRLDVADQLDWIAANQEALKPQPFTNGHTVAAAVPATPKPANGQAVATQQQQDHRQQFAGTALGLWGKR